MSSEETLQTKMKREDEQRPNTTTKSIVVSGKGLVLFVVVSLVRDGFPVVFSSGDDFFFFECFG